MEGGVVPYSSSMAPSGSYILVIVGQPQNDEHKKIILDRLNKALLSWDISSTGCDLNGLESVCSSITSKNLDDTDVLIQYSTESLGVEVLVSPTVSTLKQCVKNLLSTSTGHKHLIHTGYTFAGSGSWILQNGTFSFDDFQEISQQANVQNQKRCAIQVHCSEVGPWCPDNFSKMANVSFNADSKVDNVPGSEYLIECLERVLSSQALENIMATSNLVGNIRFNRPTLYLFPAGQGDCALFGINGFNMLIDGGFNRKPCSWEFIRHLDRLDAVLVTRLCENNVCGMSTLMQRKSQNNTYPQIGYVFCNVNENATSSNAKSEIFEEKNDLVVSVVKEGHKFAQTLNDLKLQPHQCWRESSVEPFVLYHKVGHGTLEMHVLSPPKDSKEMKEFLTQWNSYKESFAAFKSASKSKSSEGVIPLAHSTSICAVLIWRPSDPKDTITRILFPGSAPQNKIFDSLEKLKALDVLKQPIVTKESLTAAKLIKLVGNKVEKTNRAQIPNRKNTASPALSVSSAASKNGDTGGIKKEVKKVVKEGAKKDNKELKPKKEFKKAEPMATKKEVSVKKESTPKDVIKKETPEVKRAVKKDVKDVKNTAEKKSEAKTVAKKTDSASTKKPDSVVNGSKSTNEAKKTVAATTVKKTASATKKDVSKVSVQKATEVKKSTTSKISDTKAPSKDSSTKKATDTKSVPKTKPKATGPAKAVVKQKSTTEPPSVPKSGSKMTKAVAASSIVASAVAVTCAAFSLNEKKDEIVDEIETAGNVPNDEPAKTLEGQAPEALSPTSSVSLSLSPSDTLSSAPLETVSPTPPLAINEPMTLEEKEVNEVKDIEQDLASDVIADVGGVPESEKLEEEKEKEEEKEEIDVEEEIAKHQKHGDVMSMSFMESSQHEADDDFEVIEKKVAETEQFSTTVGYEEAEDETVDDNFNAQTEERNIEDQLAHLSMEGSFCEGVPAYDVQATEQDAIPTNRELNTKLETEELHYGQQNVTKVSDTNEQDFDKYDKHDEEKHGIEQDYGIEQEYQTEERVETMLEVVRQDNAAVEDQEDEYHHDEHVTDFEKESEQVVNYEKEMHAEIQSKHVAESEKICAYEEEQKEIENYQADMTKDFTAKHLDDMTKTQRDQTSFVHEAEVYEEREPKTSDNRYQDQPARNNDYESEEEKEVVEEKYFKRETTAEIHSSNEASYLREQVYGHKYNIHTENESDLFRRSQDYEATQNIIHDSDMQETSVDEPEELFEKKSNDYKEFGSTDDHKDQSESQFEYEINSGSSSFMTSDIEQIKHVQKLDVDGYGHELSISPAPIETASHQQHSLEENEAIQNEADHHTEKYYADEKDRDSAEDQDDMDGEMIRHPTPPSMKYSEEEMRDPIGPHIIMDPSLKPQGLTEETLYEESEDERASPVVEEPVFGTLGQADYPELVTVSGGTTPSEPQSPKIFDKKFVPVNEIMDALSEHENSESSNHSPLVHEGGSVFELPVEESAIISEDLKNDDLEEHLASDIATKIEIPKDSTDKQISGHNMDSSEAASDDESQSQIEKSETRSERSEGPDDEKSDRHKDDNQHDGRSDIMDDDQVESRSDIHDDDNRSDSQYDDKHDCYDGQGSNYGGSEHAYNDQFPNEKNENLLEEFESEIAMNQKYNPVDRLSGFDKQYEDVSYLRSHQYENMQGDFSSEYKDGAMENRNPCEDNIVGMSGHYAENSEIPPAYSSDIHNEGTDEDAILERDTNLEKLMESLPSDKVEQHLETPFKDGINLGGYDSHKFSEEDIINDEFQENLLQNTSEEYSREPNETEFKVDSAYQYNNEKASNEEQFSTYMTEARQSETLSKYEDNAYTSNMEYSESSVTTNVIKNEPITATQTSIAEDIDSYLTRETNYSDAKIQEQIKGTESYAEHTYSDNVETHDVPPFAEKYGKCEFSTEHRRTDSNDFTNCNVIGSATQEVQSATVSYSSESSTEYKKTVESYETINENSDYGDSGKAESHHLNELAEYQDSWRSKSEKQEKVYSAISEQESSYIINSRFHSDSPEDNIMRNDSSPDVPPFSVDSKGQMSDFSNVVPEEPFKPSSPNLNLAASPTKALRSTNRDDPYEESSEEDDSSSAPASVSSFAYTNKAYANKEEDFDGNLIYQEKQETLKTSTEILNDPHNLTSQESNINTYSETTTNYDFRVEEWGKPMGLPTPPESTAKTVKKTDKLKTQTNGKVQSPTVHSKLPGSPLKKPSKAKEPSGQPVYVDLAYVPNHGDPQYCDVEFFKKVRARYYVFSGINPSKEVFNALLEGKKTWKENLEVTIIPTYETDTLGYWMAQNQDDLALHSIEVAPSASRCTVNLQDHETSCAAYRLEF